MVPLLRGIARAPLSKEAPAHAGGVITPHAYSTWRIVSYMHTYKLPYELAWYDDGPAYLAKLYTLQHAIPVKNI